MPSENADAGVPAPASELAALFSRLSLSRARHPLSAFAGGALPHTILSCSSAALLSMFSTRAVLPLRATCKDAMAAVAAHPFEDQSALPCGSAAAWRACFPAARAVNVSRWLSSFDTPLAEEDCAVLRTVHNVYVGEWRSESEDPVLPSGVHLVHLRAYCLAALSHSSAAQHTGVYALRRLLSRQSEPPVKEVLETGILPHIVQLLAHSPSPRLRWDACWALTNVASTEHAQAVVDAGAFVPLVAAMSSAHEELREQAVWCLGNIAGDGQKFRDLVLNEPTSLSALLNNAQSGSVSLRRNATWTLSNLCRGEPSPSEEHVRTLLSALTAGLLGCEDRDILTDSAWGLSYITESSSHAHIQAVVDAPGVLARCVALMGRGCDDLTVAALRVIGNVVQGTDAQTQAACDAGALLALRPLLSHASTQIKREAAWTVSNIAAGTPRQLAAVMALPGLTASVVALLHHGDKRVRSEAAWVVYWAARNGTAQHGEALLELGVVGPLVKSLHDSRGARAEIVEVGVNAVAAVLGLCRYQDVAPLLSAERLAGMFEEADLVEELFRLEDYAARADYAASTVVAKGNEMLKMLNYGVEEEESVIMENAA